MHQVPRQVEMKPALAEAPRLPASEIRHRDREHAPWREQRRSPVQSSGRIAQMLQRMPKHHGRPMADPIVERLDLGREHTVARDALETERLTPARAQRPDQGAVARTDVEHRPCRGDAIQTPGQRRPGERQHPIAASGEPPGGGPIPGGVSALELVLGRDGKRRRRAANRTSRQPRSGHNGSRPAPGAVRAYGALAAGWLGDGRRHEAETNDRCAQPRQPVGAVQCGITTKRLTG